MAFGIKLISPKGHQFDLWIYDGKSPVKSDYRVDLYPIREQWCAANPDGIYVIEELPEECPSQS